MKYTPPLPSVGHSFHIFQKHPGVWIAAIYHDGHELHAVEGYFSEGPMDVLARLVAGWNAPDDEA